MMIDQITEFSWQVPEDGYEWLEGISLEGRNDAFLVESVGAGSVRQYNPLREHSGLFRTFADTDLTQDGILEFATRYGRLGSLFSRYIRVPGPSGAGSVREGEAFKSWCLEIHEMRKLLTLWNMVRIGDLAGLSRYIKWEGEPYSFAYYAGEELGQQMLVPPLVPAAEGTGAPSVIATATDEWLFSRIPPGDVLLPAKIFIQQRVNARLRHYQVGPRLLWDRRLAQLSFSVSGDSLIGALWVQFAQAVDGYREYRRCQECRRWFELTHERRADAKFCSGACRSRGYRDRQAQARKLAQEGVAVDEIARRLNTDVNTAKGWVRR